MQTSTPQRARRGVPKPHSAPVALSSAATKLIQQIEAEARSKLLEDLSAKDGITVLHPLDAATRRVEHNGRRYSVNDSRGAEYSAFREHVRDDTSRTNWHPAHWLVSATLVDGAGEGWFRLLGIHVTDDFGNLVEVPA